MDTLASRLPGENLIRTVPAQQQPRRERLPRTNVHTRGADNRCKACDEPFPCSAWIDVREMSHQVVATATVRARDFEHQLRAMHEALKSFESDLRNRGNHGATEG